MALKNDLIKERLKEAFGNDTQEVIGEKLHIVQGSVSKLLKGSQVPTTEMLNNIAVTYDVSVDWLLGISDKKKIDKGDLTYADILGWFDKMASMDAIWPYPKQMISVDGSNPELCQVNEVGINDEILQSIFYEWKDLHRLTPNFFKECVGKRLKEYSEIPYIEWNESVRELLYQTGWGGNVTPEFLKEFAKVYQEKKSKGEE